MRVVRITIRHTEGCPNVARAEARLREAMRDLGIDVPIGLEIVMTEDEAHRLSFTGSPTVLIDGFDPFAADGAPSALACRIYRTAECHEGAPSVNEFRAALEAAGG